MIYVSVLEPFQKLVDEITLTTAARSVLNHQQLNPDHIDLSVVVTDDASIQDLNRDYRKTDAPTDVLSFNLNEKDPETGLLYLGDVIISFQRAQEQAAKAGHSVIAEIELLTVHGVLHLLGFDHAEKEDKEKMWKAQQEILVLLNVSVNQWPED